MFHYLDIVIAFTVIMLGLSLMITLLNQMISAFLSYRGSNLRWGIQTMLSALNEGALGPHAKEIANRVLTEPIVSDSLLGKFENMSVPIIGTLLQRWKLATAISPDTLVRTLAKVSADVRAADPTVSEAINALLAAPDEGATRKLNMVKDTIGTILSATGYEVQVNNLLKELGTTTQESVGKVEAWFNVALGRISQRFTMQMRIWTIVFSFLLAFGLHLDVFNLISQLQGSPTVVQNLVNQSGAMLKEAEAVLGNPNEATAAANAPTTSPKVLGDQMKALLKEVSGEVTATPESAPAFHTLAEADNWLGAHVKSDVKPERKAELVAKYNGLVITGLRDEIRNINKTLTDTGIKLVGPHDQPIDGLRSFLTFVFAKQPLKAYLGILFSAALLSLGAPFWYNMLKNLTNLRSAVATRQDEQKAGAAK